MIENIQNGCHQGNVLSASIFTDCCNTLCFELPSLSVLIWFLSNYGNSEGLLSLGEYICVGENNFIQSCTKPTRTSVNSCLVIKVIPQTGLRVILTSYFLESWARQKDLSAGGQSLLWNDAHIQLFPHVVTWILGKIIHSIQQKFIILESSLSNNWAEGNSSVGW